MYASLYLAIYYLCPYDDTETVEISPLSQSGMRKL